MTYFALRSYQDSGSHYSGQIGSESTPQEFLEALWKATREIIRVLKPTGSMFINLGDKYAGSRMDASSGHGTWHIRPKSLMGLPWRYAIGCIDDLGLILRAEVVLDKKNELPESVTDRVRRSHEQVFHFTKSPRYFSAVDEIREPYSWISGNGLCPTCGLPRTGAGSGLDGKTPGDTVRQPRVTRRRTGHTESPMPSLWDQSPMDSPSTISAETSAVSTPNTLSQSPDESISSVEKRPTEPTACTGIPSQMLTSIDDQTAALLGNVEPAPSGECVCTTLGKLPGSVWPYVSEPLKVPSHIGVEHFAAFSSELPRRLILGWSPSGVCEACGEGRRPVVEKSYSRPRGDSVIGAQKGTYTDGGYFRGHGSGNPVLNADAAITGYTCACGGNYEVDGGTARDMGVASTEASPLTPEHGVGDAVQEPSLRPGSVPAETVRGTNLVFQHRGNTRPAVVLDPFGGTGTVAMVARALGRDAISLDLSMDYSRLAQWRIHSSGHGAKALGRTWRERQGTL